MAPVILFRPRYDTGGGWAPTFPWGLMHVAAPLQARGDDVYIIDEPCEKNYQQRLEKLLRDQPPVAVGITAMTGEQIRHGLACAAFVRARSKAAIVWGGIHASLLPEQTARHALVDYVVAGEGEWAFAELVSRLAKGQSTDGIPGVYSLGDDSVKGSPQTEPIALESIPPLPYGLVEVERYIGARPDLRASRFFEICTSRGCPHRCGFCYIEAVHHRKWRALEAEQALERIEELVNRFRLDGIQFREDNFFVNKGRVEAIAAGLIARGGRLTWAASSRIDYFQRYSDAFVNQLRRSGCAQLTFGVESGSPQVLSMIQKDIEVGMVMEVAEKALRHGIRASFHFMAGFPGETREALLETLRLMDALLGLGAGIAVRDLAVFTAYPGVALLPACQAMGYVAPDSLEGWVGLDWTTAKRPWLTPEMSALIAQARWAASRLDHRNWVIRRWAQRRWRQLLRGASQG